VYDRSEAALRRIRLRAQDGGELGRLYVHLALHLMRSKPSPLRDGALKKLADSCDDAMPLTEKEEQPPR
jgi:predicted metal-binding transcription factor (methanogenesis marker protein 9)